MALPLTVEQLTLLSLYTPVLQRQFSSPFIPPLPLEQLPSPSLTPFSLQVQQQAPPASLAPSLLPTDTRGPDGCNLFVHNLPENWKEHDLAHLFAPFGSLVSAKVERDCHGSRGYGFVSYAEERSAAIAIASLHEAVVQGKKITVKLKAESRGQASSPRHPNAQHKQQLHEQQRLQSGQTQHLHEFLQAQLAILLQRHAGQIRRQEAERADEIQELELCQQLARQQQTHHHEQQRILLRHQQELQPHASGGPRSPSQKTQRMEVVGQCI